MQSKPVMQRGRPTKAPRVCHPQPTPGALQRKSSQTSPPTKGRDNPPTHPNLQKRPAAGEAIQRRIAITNDNYMGNYAGEYTTANMVTLLNGIGAVMTRYFPGDKVKRGPLGLIRVQGLYTFANIGELIQYMLVQDGAAPMNMNLVFGDGHGDLHFNHAVTAQKAQWSISKQAAKTLMEAEINKHLTVLLAGSADAGWTPWYIGGQADDEIGDTVAGAVRMFTIQLQVSKEGNTISYHGYPDQRLLRTGVGRSKKSLEE